MSKRDIIDGLRCQIEGIEGQGPSVKPAEKRNSANKSAEANNQPGGALKKIITLASVRERSVKSVRERLVADGFDEADIEEAIEKASEYGFIDDMRFASTLVRSRLSQGRGEAGIRRELASHDIDIDAVPGWPEDFDLDSNSEVDRALQFLEKHPTRSKNRRDGAFRKLVQRGFSSEVASTAARVWSESIE